MGRAARYDGLMPYVLPESGVEAGPAAVTQMREWLAARRDLGGFDIVADGQTSAEDRAAAAETVRPWEEAGATWWIEADWSTFEPEQTRKRIAAGPPRA
jgi:hypothetical protein